MRRALARALTALLVPSLLLSLPVASCGPGGGPRRNKDALSASDADTAEPSGDADRTFEPGDAVAGEQDTGTKPPKMDVSAAVDVPLIGTECEPGTVDCNGTSVVACAAGGAGWMVVETCTGATKCDPASGTCVCMANCANKECGEDGCGGTCGTCPGGKACTYGSCECTPSCADKQCGNDGCGGSCGSCSGGATCTAQGTCKTVGPTCVPGGTGTTQGKQIKNLTWTSSEGTTVELHAFCKAEGAVVLVEVAGW